MRPRNRFDRKGREERKGRDSEDVSRIIVNAALKVHTSLDTGLLEDAYQVRLKHELEGQNLPVLSEVSMQILYDEVSLDADSRGDLLLERSVVGEQESVTQLAPIHKAQLPTYLKLSKVSLGLLLNFNSPHHKECIVRMINS